MRVRIKRSFIAFTLCVTGVVTLGGCGVVQDTIDGMTGQEATSRPSSPHSPDAAGTEDLTVTVTVESDADTTGELSVEIDAPGGGQSLREESVRLPFAQDFTVPTDRMFPLRAVRLDVEAGPAASYIECSISVDGHVVAAHRAEGSSVTAICDRRLQLGPS